MMSTKTAQDVVRFIERSCGNSPIRIRWFGGEPTVAADRIDQISQGLCDCGVKYSSIHDHDVVLQNQYNGPLTIVGHIAIDFPTWFKGDGETKELLPLGEWLPLPDRGVICIDTGSGKGGRLTAMVIEGKQFRLESV